MDIQDLYNQALFTFWGYQYFYYEREFYAYLSHIRRYSPQTIQSYTYSIQLWQAYWLLDPQAQEELTQLKQWDKGQNDLSSSTSEKERPTIFRKMNYKQSEQTREYLSVYVKKTEQQRQEFFKSLQGQQKIREQAQKKARQFLRFLSYHGYHANSVNRCLSALRSFEKFCENQSSCLSIFTELENRRKNTSIPQFLFENQMKDFLKPHPDILNPEQIAAEEVQKGLKQMWLWRDQALLELFYSTGMRIGEMVILSSAIEHKDKLVIDGKGHKKRTVYINLPAQQAIHNYLQLRRQFWKQDNGALWINHQNKNLTIRGISFIFKKNLKQRMNMTYMGVHSIRHSFASHMLEKGIDLRVLQELLGHKNLSATQIYSHWNWTSLQKVYEQAHPHGG